MTDTKKPDWERIEADYRAGILSVREIALSQGVSHVAIWKRAKRDGWERDLKAKIQTKADALVNKNSVNNLVNAEKAVTEKLIVDANAQAIANIRMSHRTDISRARALSMALLEEVEQQTGNLDLYEQIGELLRREDDKGVDKLNDLYHKVISSAGRVDTMKKLAEALKNLIALEREAYGLSTSPDNPHGAVPTGLTHFYGQ